MSIKVVINSVANTRTLVISSPEMPRALPWMAKAECFIRGINPNKFFERPVPAEVINACNACKVRLECLDYSYIAEDPKLRDGIWGGLTARQRTNHQKGVPVHRPKSAVKLAKTRKEKALYHRRKYVRKGKENVGE